MYCKRTFCEHEHFYMCTCVCKDVCECTRGHMLIRAHTHVYTRAPSADTRTHTRAHTDGHRHRQTDRHRHTCIGLTLFLSIALFLSWNRPGTRPLPFLLWWAASFVLAPPSNSPPFPHPSVFAHISPYAQLCSFLATGGFKVLGAPK